MTRKIILIMVSILLITTFLHADEKTVPGQDTDQPRGGIVIPEVLKQYEEAIRAEIDKKNFAPVEIPQSDIKTINYNQDGTISSVSYEDGTKFDYSYKYDNSGDLAECTMQSDKVKINFEKCDDGKIKISVELKNRQGEAVEDSLGKGKTKPAIVFYYAKDTIKLNDVATKPIKFNPGEIAKAISKTMELNKAALDAYSKNTSVYYEKISAKINNDLEGAGAENKKLAGLIKNMQKEGASAPGRREAVDRAVEYIYSDSRNSSPKEATADFIVFEKSLRGSILVPQKKIYDKKIEAAVRYINGMIDKLINSKLAVYLDVKKEKIDAIINLPELKPQNKAKK